MASNPLSEADDFDMSEQLQLTPEDSAQTAWDILESGIYDSDPDVRAALRAEVQAAELNGMIFADTLLLDPLETNVEADEANIQSTTIPRASNTPAFIPVADANGTHTLMYAVEIERDSVDHNSAFYTVFLTKQIQGSKSNGLVDSREIGDYQVYEGGDDLAASIVHDLYDLKDSVEALTGSEMDGVQAMVSMAHQIALDNGMIEESEPFFADERLPTDPFEIEGLDVLIGRYQIVEREDQHADIDF